MKAVVLDAPGPVESMHLREVPDPVPQPGWVLIEVRAAGLNRSELHTRLGMAEGMVFPRVLGLEAAGVVVECPGGEFEVGTQVVAMMGGMGRQFDGGYAELTCVPVRQVIPFTSTLPWSVLGAVPEMLQTAYGSLTVGLDMQPGQTLLIRGATSSVGMAAAVLAKREGLQVIGTTRNPASADRLREIGVDQVLVDDGPLADAVRRIVPDGVDIALDLVGTPTLMDCLHATRVHGVVCMSGMLSNQWTLPDFYPTGDIPSGVRLTGYTGDATDLPPEVLQSSSTTSRRAGRPCRSGRSSTSSRSRRPTGSWKPARPAARLLSSRHQGALDDRSAARARMVDRAGPPLSWQPAGRVDAPLPALTPRHPCEATQRYRVTSEARDLV